MVNPTNDSAHNGRLERGRKDCDRHAAQQEPHRRVLAARVSVAVALEPELAESRAGS